MAGGNKDPNSMGNSPGASAIGSSSIEALAALSDALDKAALGGKKGSKELKNLNDRMETLSKAVKKSKDPITVLTQSFASLKAGGKDASGAIEVLASEIEKSVEVMTTSSRKTLESNIEGIKKMQADLVTKGKGGGREMMMLNSKRSQLEMQAFKDQKNFMIERAKMLQRGSEGIVGVGKGLAMGPLNAAMKHGTEAAEFLGGALGLTAGTMMTVATIAGAVAAGFMAFVWAAKKSSKMMSDMTEAGDTMAVSVDESRMASVQYYNEVKAAAADSNIVFDKMQELMVSMNHEYGRSLGLGADFVGTVANVGKTFGMTNEESVKLATRMGVLSRTTNQYMLKLAFTDLGAKAADLRLPMEALAEPMMMLSELAGKTGHNVMSAADSMGLMLQSAQSLEKSGVNVFKNMQPADIAKFSKEFTGFMTNIDEWMLAAMTFKDDESFQGMSERVAGMNTNDRVDAIRQTMKDNELFGRQHAAELGMILGAKNPSEALSRGLMAQSAVSGSMNDSEYNSLMAKDLNRQLAERKSAGEAIQFGTDPTAFMMDRVQKIMESLIDIQGVITGWKGILGIGGPVSTVATATVKGAANYGAGTIMTKRENTSVPVSSSTLH